MDADSRGENGIAFECGGGRSAGGDGSPRMIVADDPGIRMPMTPSPTIWSMTPCSASTALATAVKKGRSEARTR
jgi:hypothetical protein